jgi:glycosyltransferase involved in cell wall biosynthesis
MYRYFLKKCFRIRVYSQTTKDKIVQTFGLPPHKIYIIEDVPFHLYYPNTVTKEESRKLLKLSSEQFVYLFLGMIKPYKGIEDLITAFQAVKSGNDFLIIAGSSDSPAYVATLRSLIARQPAQILFVNEFVPETAVQLYFNAANVVALPFKNIEHSGSIDLAMSFAKPVITLYTDFTSALLPHQQELLFKNTAELKEKLIAAKHIDGQTVGQTNFSIANRSNYQELVSFFKTDYTQTSSLKR